MKPESIIVGMTVFAAAYCLIIWLGARAAKRKNVLRDAEDAEVAAMLQRRKVVTKRGVRLSRTTLEEINLKRRLAGRSPLNAAGISQAIASAPAGQQSTSSSDWILYLMLYNALIDDHQGYRADIGQGVTIEPGGGSFGGAGATGVWDDPAGAAATAPSAGLAMAAGGVIGAGAAIIASGATAAPTPAPADPDPMTRSGGPTGEPAVDVPVPAPASEPVDTSSRESYGSGYSAPDPTPSYSAPDPSPSYDSSSSSSSYDSGGSSGGGDSGGGGGGGGD